MNFLVRGEQIAFDPVRDHIDCVTIRLKSDAPHAIVNPTRQLPQTNGPDWQEDARRCQGLDPFGIAVTAIEFWRNNDKQQLWHKPLDKVADRGAAIAAGLARGQSQFDDALIREQRQIGARCSQLQPVETGHGNL